MTETDSLRAEVEALKITLAALYQTLPPQWQEAYRANVANVRRHTSNALLRIQMSEEQIERVDEMLLAMTWTPPDVAR